MNRRNQPKSVTKRNLRFGISLGLTLVLLCLVALSARLRLPFNAFSAVKAASSLITPLRQNERTSVDGIWQLVDESSIASFQIDRSKLPQSYRVVQLNQVALTRLLRQAPMEYSEAAKAIRVVVTLPMPNGEFARFRIEESPVMKPALMARYPDVKTYQGQGIDDRRANAL